VATGEGTTAKVMVGKNWMTMTEVLIDAVIVVVASKLDRVAVWVSGGCVFVCLCVCGGWMGPYHFHCLTPCYRAGDVCYISFFFQSAFYLICSVVISK
jgi:hypothetical protein